MAEYIEREALLQKAWDADTRIGYVQVVDVGDILDMPAADVVPVVHGEWIPISDGEWAECSECGDGCEVSDNGGMTVFKLFCEFYKYCPNCGAKMDGGDENALD